MSLYPWLCAFIPLELLGLINAWHSTRARLTSPSALSSTAAAAILPLYPAAMYYSKANFAEAKLPKKIHPSGCGWALVLTKWAFYRSISIFIVVYIANFFFFFSIRVPSEFHFILLTLVYNQKLIHTHMCKLWNIITSRCINVIILNLWRWHTH